MENDHVCLLKTDNGLPFISHQFKTFATNMGFKHQRITPIWPQANGEANIFMRNLGKVTRSAVIEGRPWKCTNLRNHTATPQSSTCIAPATTLFGREIKTKLLTSTNSGTRQSVERKRQGCEKEDETVCRSEMTRTITRHCTGKRSAGTATKDRINWPHHLTIVQIQKKGTMISAHRGDRNITRN